jgi:hypothetical protein
LTSHSYILWGIRVQSEFPFPTLHAIDSDFPELIIRRGKVTSLIDEELISAGTIYGDYIDYQATNNGIKLHIKGVGYIWIDNSGVMTMELIHEDALAEMRFYILGAVLGIYFIYKGAFPIHGSTVAGEEGSILFCGPSGAGKSTTTAWFMDHGYSLVADDISLVHFSGNNTPRVWPGIPQIKLWDDSAIALSRDPGNLPKVLDNWEKRRLPVAASDLVADAPLSAIFYIRPETCDYPSIRMLHGTERFAAIAGNIYRGETILNLGKGSDHFAFVSRLAASVPVFALSRPQGRFALKEIQEIVEHALYNLHEKDTVTR